VVLPLYSEIMVAALKAAKASVKYTLYPDANHNSWDAAFAEPELLSWLFAQRK
jgi:predicted peptidase